ncbi:MAG: MFS transporter [Lachnospiraceae bacterium]
MNKKRTIVVTLALLMSNAMAGLDGTIVNTALPSIVSELQGIQYMGWIVAVFLLGMAVATPLWSKAGERIGNKRTYQIATLLFALGALFQALSGNIISFLIARAIMGIGAGGMNAIPFIIYVDLYEDLKKRSKVIGYATASFSAASIVGPLVGGWIVDSFSWHWVFYINIPIAVLSILCIQVFFAEPKKELAGKPVDFAGAAVLVISLVMLLTGIQLVDTLPVFAVVGLVAVGILLLVFLSIIEGQAIDPIIPKRLFKNLPLVADFLLFALLWGAFIAFNIYIPMWAQGVLGLSALVGGATQIPGAFTNFAGSMNGSAIQSKVGKYRAVAIGTLAFIAAFAIMVVADGHTQLWVLLVAGAFEGVGLGISFNVLQLNVQEDAERRDVPIATSFAYLLRILSQTFMSAVYGVILSHSIMQGVNHSGGAVTVAMMNDLSNNSRAGELPAELLPEMKGILFQGLHNIMITALVLLLLALLFNLAVQKKVAVKHSKRIKNVD